MQNQTETPTKKFFIPEHIYRQLERKAKAEGVTPDEYAETLLLGAMIIDHIPARCPHCKKTILIPHDGPQITGESFQQFVKDDLKDWKKIRILISDK